MNIKIKREWIGVLVITLALSVFFLIRGVPSLEVAVPEEIPVSTIKVYIHGEVINPGVYELEGHARLEQVLDMAGGFTESADTRQVNLARTLEDGEMITIYPIREEVTYHGVDRFNYGSKDEIMTVAGIGETLATRIINYRNAHGFFQDFDDLLSVDGIGESKLKNIKDALNQ